MKVNKSEISIKVLKEKNPSASDLFNTTSRPSSCFFLPVAPLLNGCFITVKSRTSLLATSHLVLLWVGRHLPHGLHRDKLKALEIVQPVFFYFFFSLSKCIAAGVARTDPSHPVQEQSWWVGINTNLNTDSSEEQHSWTLTCSHRFTRPRDFRPICGAAGKVPAFSQKSLQFHGCHCHVLSSLLLFFSLLLPSLIFSLLSWNII